MYSTYGTSMDLARSNLRALEHRLQQDEGGHRRGWTQARVDTENAGEGIREDTSLGANAGSKALEA